MAPRRMADLPAGGGATSVEPRMEPTVDDVRLLPERQKFEHDYEKACRLDPGWIPVWETIRARALNGMLWHVVLWLYLLPPLAFAGVMFLLFKVLEAAGATSASDFEVESQ